MQDLDERMRCVRTLLATRFDYLPDPKTSTGIIARDSHGPAPSKRVPCGHCRRKGQILGHKGWLPCSVCGGDGWRKRRAGDEPWDEYINAPVGGKEKRYAPRQFRIDEDIRRLDVEIDKLERQAQLREGRIDAERYAWETERAILFRRGSYKELDRAMGLLAERAPGAHRSVARAFDAGWRGITLAGQVQALEALGVQFLAETMRGEIRVPPWAGETAKREKQLGVRELHALGWAPGKIGSALRISRKKVKRLIAAL